MKTLTTRRQRMWRAAGALGAALAVAGMLAATSRAEHPNDRAGMLGPGATAAVSVVSERPDDQAGSRGPGVVSPTRPVRPDDRAGIRGPVGLTPAQVALPSVSSHNGFQWGDATLGAVAMLGAVLAVLAAGMLALAVRKRGHAVST